MQIAKKTGDYKSAKIKQIRRKVWMINAKKTYRKHSSLLSYSQTIPNLVFYNVADIYAIFPRLTIVILVVCSYVPE